MKRLFAFLFIAVLIVAAGCGTKPATPPTHTDNTGTTYTAPETATEKSTPEPTEIPAGTPPETGGESAGPHDTVTSDEVPIPVALETKVTPVDSAIDSVTVYMDRAAITRKAKLSLEAGSYDLVFSKLPAAVIWDSVRARGSDKIKVVNVKMESEHILQPDDPQVKKLTDDYKAKNKEIQALNDEGNALSKRENLLDSIRMRSGEKDSQQMEGNIDVTKVGEMMDFLDKKYMELAAQRRDLGDRMQKAQEELNLIERDLQDLNSKLTVENIKAIVTIVVSEKTDEDIALDYLASGAGWHAEYDLRASGTDDTAELSYFGVVSQYTGEDWKDVQMFLSTTDPNINVIPPVLSVWNIGLWREQPNAPANSGKFYSYQGELNKPAMEKAQQQSQQAYQNTMDQQGGLNYALEEATSSPKDAYANAQVVSNGERGGVGVNFALPRKESVVSGAEPHRTIIAIRKLTPKTTYITVPRIAQKVYMRAEITNNTPFTLLAGNVSVFLGSDFIGVATIADVAPMQMFRVNFGVDQGITVKRERIKKFEEDVGWGGKTHRITYEYKITLENFKKTEVTVKVVDQIPVSTDNNITVKLIGTNFPLTTEEPTATDNKAKGMLEWHAKLPADPKRKNEITFSFYIEYPKGTNVVGQE